MKRYVISIMIIGLILLSSIVHAKNKYDVLLENQKLLADVETFITKINKYPLFIDYVNAVIVSPKKVYKILDEYDCDKEILQFVKKNKSFTRKLLCVRISLILIKLNPNNKELLFVTNYIQDPKAMAATNAQQMGTETMMMREMSTFKLYELFKDEKLKIQVEQMLSSMVKW